MKYTHYLYKLPCGHTIITPHGKEISEEEFREYFDIASNWLKEVRPKAYKRINPNPDNKLSYNIMLNEMFEAYLYDFRKGGIQEVYFLDKRALAFIFVVSYFIQQENRERIGPFLSHVMGNALLLWLPIKELVEYYLSLSLEVGRLAGLTDGLLLVRLFCPNFGLSDYGFDKDVDKALEYATRLYNHPFNSHKMNLYDYGYARALFEKDPSNANKCIEIIEEKLNKYDIDAINDVSTLLNYLNLELEIYSKVSDVNIDLDLERIEEILSKQNKYSFSTNNGYYFLAECYLNGKNNDKDIDKGIELLSKINDPHLFKKVGIALASLYLNGDGVEYDPKEAYDIASIAEGQANRYPFNRETDKEILDIKKAALAKTKE